MNFPRLLLRLLLGRRLPRAAGELRVRGPERPVTIRRDKWGIPAVEAETETDAAFGLGFCHGQDRAFQLEVIVRVTRGTLAELVGPDGLPADRMSRRIGFRRAADAMLAACEPDVQAVLVAYTAGVNAGATTGLPAGTHELAILSADRTDWEPADVFGFTKLQSFLLPSNWDVELARLRLLRADGPDAVRALDPVPPEWLPAIGTLGPASRLSEEAVAALEADLAAFAKYAPRGGGSNNWAVAGGRTASGKPVLASDPHLAPSAPSPWYLASVRTPDWAVAGAAFAGSPVFPIAHNGFACWGVTAGLTDNSDFFLETLGPDGKSVREADGSFRPCEVRREVIRVKGGPDVVEAVLVTSRGPVLSPVLPGITDALSLRAVWLEPLPLRGFLDAPRARSFEQFRRAFAHWPVLPLNVAYADAAGHIGWQLTGQVPRRKAGFGTVPLPADAPGVGWEPECVPFDEMPFMADPAEGFLATANNVPSGRAARVSGPVVDMGNTGLLTQAARQEPFLGIDYMDGYRAAVIAEELGKRGGWDVPACLALQRNQRSRPWEEIRDPVFALAPADPDARLGLELLRDWDGHVTEDSPAAAVYELFVAELCVRAARAKAPKAWDQAVGGSGPGVLNHSLFADRRVGHLVRLVREQPTGWFPRPWADEMCDALGAVVKQLRASTGPGPAYWGWGHLRPLVLKHPVFGTVKRLAAAFNVGPVPIGGDANTVFQAGCAPLTPTDPTHNIPNLRTAFDTADWANSRFVLAGGQSGNPCSPHYDDQFELWQAGEAIPIAWTPDEVIRTAKASLRLVPDAGEPPA
jgi:penicillin amidase